MAHVFVAVTKALSEKCQGRCSFLTSQWVGWPRVLNSRGATSGPPVKLLGHRAKDLLFELRERSLAVWHSRVSRRSWWSHHACVSHHDHGVVILHSFTYCWRYPMAVCVNMEWTLTLHWNHADGTFVVVSVSENLPIVPHYDPLPAILVSASVLLPCVLHLLCSQLILHMRHWFIVTWPPPLHTDLQGSAVFTASDVH